MKKWIKRFSSLCLIAAGLQLSAQDTPIGTWRTHFSYNNARMLASGNQKIFCAAENGLFFIDLSDNSLNKLSKLNGLSDMSPTSMGYDATANTLILGYASGLIDLVTTEEVVTITDIYETNLSLIKTMRDIAIHDGRVYLATSFGILVVSLERQGIVETFRSVGPNGTDVTVQHLEVIGDQLFAVTDNGIQTGDLNLNLLDFNNWVRYPETSEGNYTEIEAVNDTVYSILDNRHISYLADGVWNTINLDTRSPIVDLLSQDGTLYVLGEKAIYTLNNDSLTLHTSYPELTKGNDFLFNDGFWIADGKNGLIDPSGSVIIPNGPLSDDITNLSFADNKLYALYGKSSQSLEGNIDSTGYSYFDNKTWKNESIEGFFNITDATLFNNTLYLSSAGYGLYDATAKEALNVPLNSQWSPLGPVVTDLLSEEELYIFSYDSLSPVYTLDDQMNLTTYTSSVIGTSTPWKADISEHGVLWLLQEDNFDGGILAANLETNEVKTIRPLPSSTVHNLTIDYNDDVWIATAEGPAIFPNASYPFDGQSPILPIFENGTLFEDERILSIAVDGGNRIWISTSTGIYLFNSSITELVRRFTITNSPLPSTRVSQFAYNEQNGEMFILTEKGMMSLRTGSSLGTKKHQQVNIFPNPVRPGYAGQVGISGLTTNASLKITDVNGKLIRHIDATGGTAAWDLLDYNQHEVNSGIYVIFSSSDDGEETYIGKIAVIR